MLLDLRERLRFAEFCRTQAVSCQAVAEQMEKLSLGFIDTVAKRERSKAAAFTIVALELSADREEFSVGKESIGGPPDPPAPPKPYSEGAIPERW